MTMTFSRPSKDVDMTLLFGVNRHWGDKNTPKKKNASVECDPIVTFSYDI